MGLLMAAKYSGRPNYHFADHVGQFWELSFWGKMGVLILLFYEETVFEETILLSRLQAKVPHPK